VRVSRLLTTPIKGFALHEVGRIEIDANGAVGDRDFLLVDEQGELVSVGQTGDLMGLQAQYDLAEHRLMLRDGSVVLVDGVIELGASCSLDFYGLRAVTGHQVRGPWAEFLSERIGQRVHLVRTERPGDGHDVEPLTLLGAASVAALAQRAGADVDPRRFRMLIELDGTEPFAEDDWLGCHLQIGSAVIEAGGPVRRCVGTTRNPATGRIDQRTLTIIGQVRGRQKSIFGLGFNLGVYARCVSPGTISLGDQAVFALRSTRMSSPEVSVSMEPSSDQDGPEDRKSLIH